jgi:hypothetical protein
MTQSSTWPLLPLQSQACTRSTTWTYSSSPAACQQGPSGWTSSFTTSACLEEKFLRMMLQRYPHATSSLSSLCELNIIVSRYTHMRRVITSKEDFCWHLARMMFDFYRRGYNMRPMWKRLERCLRWQPAFKPTPWYTLYRCMRRIFWAATSAQAFSWAPLDTTVTANSWHGGLILFTGNGVVVYGLDTWGALSEPV